MDIDMYSFATYGLNAECTDIIPANTLSEFYWNHSAPNDEVAQTLISKLDINFPLLLEEENSSSPERRFARSVMRPLYHLVIRGEDSEGNMTLLLGPTWKIDGSLRSHLICRLLVLMDPSSQKGSVPFRAAKVFHDAAPSLGGLLRENKGTHTAEKKWNPGGATEVEGVFLRRIKWEKSEHGFKAAPAPMVEFREGLTQCQQWKVDMDRAAKAFFLEIGMV